MKITLVLAPLFLATSALTPLCASDIQLLQASQQPDPSGWYQNDGSGNGLGGFWFGPEGLAKVRALIFTFQGTWTRRGNAVFLSWKNSDGKTVESRFLIQPGGTLKGVDDELVYKRSAE